MKNKKKLIEREYMRYPVDLYRGISVTDLTVYKQCFRAISNNIYKKIALPNP